MNVDQSIRFLVIDDVAPMRLAIQNCLRHMGFQHIALANDGKEAKDYLEREPVDCIISDWSMPEVTGLELLRYVRSSSGLKKIRFMLVTAIGERENVEQAIAEGVDQFLVKPFTQASLAQKVVSMLRQPAHLPTAASAPLEQPGMAAAPTPSSQSSKGMVLIVDDISSNLDVLVGLLKDTYILKAARSGKAALKICEADRLPDLILLDIMMPEMDGFEVCRQLKLSPRTNHIPIIFLTAKAETVDITQGFSLGAVDYITKPPEPEVLKARVATHLRLKQSRDELEERIDTIMENARLREEVEQITRHDLKNPLASVITTADLLLDNRWMAVEQKEQVEEIRSTTYKVLGMINRSLDLYKMEIGTYELKPEPFNLVDTLMSVVNDCRKLGQHRHVGIFYDAPEQSLVLAEEVLCYTLFSNLVRNAVEASPEKATVSVEIQAGKDPLVKIHNQGAIPNSIRETLFEKHVTAGKKRGTGLGTYSAKLLTEAQKGDINFTSSENEGTTFYIRLPAA